MRVMAAVHHIGPLLQEAALAFLRLLQDAELTLREMLIDGVFDQQAHCIGRHRVELAGEGVRPIAVRRRVRLGSRVGKRNSRIWLSVMAICSKCTVTPNSLPKLFSFSSRARAASSPALSKSPK